MGMAQNSPATVDTKYQTCDLCGCKGCFLAHLGGGRQHRESSKMGKRMGTHGNSSKSMCFSKVLIGVPYGIICSLKQMLVLYESKWIETYDKMLGPSDPGDSFGDTSPVLLQQLVLTHKLGCIWLHMAGPCCTILSVVPNFKGRMKQASKQSPSRSLARA